MKTAIISILMSAIVGFVVCHFTIIMDNEEVQHILAENEALKIDNQYIEGQAYSDCQRMMQTNRKIDKVDGCMKTVEKLLQSKSLKQSCVVHENFYASMWSPGGIVPIESAYFLMIRYPMLGNYIQEAWNRGDHEELIDFLFGLEMEEVVYV